MYKHDGEALRAIEKKAEQGDLKALQTAIPPDFKKRLQTARVAQKLTQKQLAQKVAVKPSLMADYETGKAFPPPAVLSKLKRVLGITDKPVLETPVDPETLAKQKDREQKQAVREEHQRQKARREAERAAQRKPHKSKFYWHQPGDPDDWDEDDDPEAFYSETF